MKISLQNVNRCDHENVRNKISTFFPKRSNFPPRNLSLGVLLGDTIFVQVFVQEKNLQNSCASFFLLQVLLLPVILFYFFGNNSGKSEPIRTKF